MGDEGCGPRGLRRCRFGRRSFGCFGRRRDRLGRSRGRCLGLRCGGRDRGCRRLCLQLCYWRRGELVEADCLDVTALAIANGEDARLRICGHDFDLRIALQRGARPGELGGWIRLAGFALATCQREHRHENQRRLRGQIRTGRMTT